MSAAQRPALVLALAPAAAVTTDDRTLAFDFDGGTNLERTRG